ncbi:hypothetical protein EJ07DRAFT_179698 [Lizonia empirigonia]|nr:hypothetical protein EJ07DRAFT_179698 [Lizonia empirigonia]
MALTAETTENKSPQNTMAGEDKKNDTATGNAPGVGGNSPIGNSANGSADNKDTNAGFGLDNKDKDVKGSLKIHIKLDLEADIRIIAKIKGDIAIGLL